MMRIKRWRWRRRGGMIGDAETMGEHTAVMKEGVNFTAEGGT